MKKIEKEIREQRDQLDGFEPAAGHFDRFRMKLEQRNRGWLQRIPFAIRAAVILALVAVGSVLLYETIRSGDPRLMVLEARVPAEFGKARVYYTTLISAKNREITDLFAADPEQQAIWAAEMERMDRLFLNLKKDLRQNPTDERILSAMIAHYQMKLEVMGRILEQLEYAKTIQSTYEDHENTEI